MVRTDLSASAGFDAQSDGNACLEGREVGFDPFGRTASYMRDGSLRIRDLATGAERTQGTQGNLWRSSPGANEGWVQVRETPGAQPGFPQQRTSCACQTLWMASSELEGSIAAQRMSVQNASLNTHVVEHAAHSFRVVRHI